MKKILLIIAIFFTLMASAQDVIALRDGTQIENVQITSITNEEITYTKEGDTLSIPHNSAEAILYADGRFETITPTLVGDSVSKATVENLGYDAQELQTMIENGQDPKAFLWQDESYPANCRKEGRKAYYKVFKEQYSSLYKAAKKNGLSNMEAVNKATEDALPKAMKAGNEALRECNNGMTVGSSTAQKSSNTAEDATSSERLIPQICYTEGKKAYDATYKEGQAQAIRKGYSKGQAILIAGEFAEQAKRKAIDECYETIVERDEELSPGTNNYANPSVSLFAQYELSASGKAIIPQACTEEGKNAYKTTYTEAEAKALRQGYSKSQAKIVATEAAEKAKKDAIDECYDNVVNKGQDYYPEGDNTTSREEKTHNQKAETERIIPQACLIEGERIYTKALKEAQEIALKQGYSKDQAKTIAPEIAEKAKAKAIDDCYNRVVVLGEDFFSETGEDEEDKPVVQGPVSLGLSEKSKQIIPQACYTEGKKAYDNTYEKTHAKALRQGYSKSQAAKIASETAQKAQQATIDDYYDIIVIKGEYYPTETVQKDDKTSPKAKASKVTQESTSQDPTLQYTSEPKTVESEPTEEYYQPQNNKVYNGEESFGEYEDESIESINNQVSQLGSVLKPEPEPEPIPKQKRGIEFRASKSFIEFTETGGETRIEIISDEAWEVAEMPSWVDTRQKGDVLIINVAQNELTSNREGDIVLLNKHQTELRIVVAQGRNNDYLKLSAPGIDDTEGVGGAYTIKVNSNKAWDAKTDADWCTIEKSGENFVVRLASNMSGKKREATIEVTASQSVIAKQVFWVKQSPLNHYIFISPSSVTSKGKKGIITINVTTDMPKYRIEDVPDWCSISQMKANSFILEIADNSGGAAREAQIKVAVDGGKSKILTVQQEELMNYVSVSPKIITASPRGGIITIHVEGSGAWRVVNLPDWCQTTEQTNDSFTLIIEKNDTDAPRNASFSVSVNGVREQIEVRQQ